MKECPHCSVLLFDDQEYCYECMSPLQDVNFGGDVPDSDASMICIAVIVGDSFSYEAHMRRTEGAMLSVGGESKNAIVIPQAEILGHQFDIFYSQGHLWVEDKSSAVGIASTTRAQINGVPLNGTRSIQPGARITLGDTCLSLV